MKNENLFKTKTEEFVFTKCRHTFLSLWSYPNPIRKKTGKELCDILIVSDPYVVIFSVKDIQLTENNDIAVIWNRWQRKAIDESTKQIYGAERIILLGDEIVQTSGEKIVLPLLENMGIIRIAVAIGGNNSVPFTYGDFGKGFIHVFTETSLELVLHELDTITDFIDYIECKEKYFSQDKQAILLSSEQDFLAHYLSNSREFPSPSGFLIIGDDIWNNYIKSIEYKNKKEADQISYIWDLIIENISIDISDNNLLIGSDNDEAELVMRVMAKEDRLNRRFLAKAFAPFFDPNNQIERKIAASDKITYVFIESSNNENIMYIKQKLSNLCLIARSMVLDNELVIGISIQKRNATQEIRFDINYLKKEDLPDNELKTIEKMRNELGYFSENRAYRIREDEYPTNPLENNFQ